MSDAVAFGLARRIELGRFGRLGILSTLAGKSAGAEQVLGRLFPLLIHLSFCEVVADFLSFSAVAAVGEDLFVFFVRTIAD